MCLTLPGFLQDGYVSPPPNFQGMGRCDPPKELRDNTLPPISSTLFVRSYCDGIAMLLHTPILLSGYGIPCSLIGWR